MLHVGGPLTVKMPHIGGPLTFKMPQVSHVRPDAVTLSYSLTFAWITLAGFNYQDNHSSSFLFYICL